MLKRLKKDAVVILLILGILLLSAFFIVGLRIYERGRNTKSYLRKDWELTRRRWLCHIRRIRKSETYYKEEANL
jgi:hypothetical protein